jgi:glucose/arabinose dehydrogenase
VRQATREATRAATMAAIDAETGESGLKLGEWKALGPFDLRTRDWASVPLPADGTVDLNATYLGADGKRIRWQPWTSLEGGTIVNFFEFSKGRPVVCFGAVPLVAERAMPVTLIHGADPGMVVWINGREVLRDPGPHLFEPNRAQLLTRLDAGTNMVLVKSGYVGTGYGFQLKFSSRTPEELERRQRLLDDLDARLQADFPEGEQAAYRIEPVAVPPGVSLEVGGLAARGDGRVFICTRRGEVWLADLATREWKLFASGLHEPLGIFVENDHQILVAQRPELTRLKDTNRDGAADEFETVVDLFGLSGNFHEYHYGPVRDAAGNLYGTLNLSWSGIAYSGAPLRGWAYQVTPQGQFVPFALGLRSPNGLGISPESDVFVVDSQGEWFGGSPLFHLQRGKFYGHPGGLVWTQNYKGPENPNQIDPKSLEPFRTPPAAWFVYGPLGQSPGQPVWDMTRGKFGPFGGQMFVGDQAKSMMLRVALEKVGGEWQGAIFPFRSGYASGLVRSAWLPDGSLLSGMTDRGWGSVGGRPFALQRTIWTGKVPMEIHSMKLTPTGFDLVFTQPLDAATASKPSAYSLSHFHYLYHSQYGSPKQAETPVPVRAVKLSADGRTASLTLGEMVAGKIYELHLNSVKSAGGEPVLHPEAYYTLNKVAGK